MVLPAIPAGIPFAMAGNTGSAGGRREVEQLLATASPSLVRKIGDEEVEVTLVAPASLDTAQVGYAVAPDGQSLVGGEGRWKPEWLVIGYDAELGDPLFVDLNDLSMPVYTAMHGAGTWKPTLVASDVRSFLQKP